MKVKRFKNLWTMGLILSAVILGAIYLLKIFMPHFVIGVAHIDRIVEIGHYIDTHKWAWYVASITLTFFIFYFLCCASSGRKKLEIKELFIMCAVFLSVYIVREFANEYYMAFNYVSMIVAPCLCKGKMINTTICFSSLMFLQVATLSIRNLATMISDANFATLLILMIDYYILIILLYLAFNYKKEN